VADTSQLGFSGAGSRGIKAGRIQVEIELVYLEHRRNGGATTLCVGLGIKEGVSQHLSEHQLRKSTV
jgi:hypothetical protein